MISLRKDTRFPGYNKKIWIVAFLIALITFLVYLPALQNDFVNWDDQQYIYANQHIRSIDLKFLMWMFSTFHASNWHPLTWLSHAIDYAIWGLNPLGHHLTSIIFHGLNTFLVVILIIRLVSYANPPLPPFTEHTSIIAGVVTGLLFGLHPLHVESVAWVSERKDVLYAFFFLLSILSYLRYASSLQKQELSGHSSLVTRHWWYPLCLLFFILSLMSKPMAVTLPVVLLILDIYPLGRLNLKSGFRSQRKVLIEKLPFIVLGLASSVVTILAQKASGAIIPLEKSILTDRILVAFSALCFYLLKTVWPTNLAPLYPYPSKISFLSMEYMGSLVLLVAITTFCIYVWHKGKRIFLAVWLYYVLTLLPVLGILQIGGQAAADRYTYLPSLGPFLLIGLVAVLLWEKVYIKKYNLILRKLYILVLFVPVLFLLSNSTVKQIKIWKDGITLWTVELKLFPDSHMAYKNRGEVQENKGNYQKAIEDYNRAIKLNLFDAEAYFYRGVVYTRLDKYHEAIENYNTVIMINPDAMSAYYNRGIVYKNLGRYQEAIKDFDMAIALDSQYMAAYLNRGNVYTHLGNYQKAIQDFNKVIGLSPYNADAYNKRGIVYSNLGDHQHAIQDFNMAIKLRSEYTEAYNNRGNIYTLIGKYEQAIKDFDTAIKLNPEIADIYVNRATLSLQLRKGNQAIKDFQIAARLGDKRAQDYLKSKGIGW